MSKTPILSDVDFPELRYIHANYPDYWYDRTPFQTMDVRVAQSIQETCVEYPKALYFLELKGKLISSERGKVCWTSISSLVQTLKHSAFWKTINVGQTEEEETTLRFEVLKALGGQFRIIKVTSGGNFICSVHDYFFHKEVLNRTPIFIPITLE